jgi:hypothetical protein
VERLTYILDVSPASGNKSVPIGLAAAVAAKDPRCAMVAQASFWRLSGGSSGGAQWHWHPVIDPIHRSPFSPFPIRFTILVLA